MDENNKVLLLIDHPALKQSLSHWLNGFRYHFLSSENDAVQKAFDEVPHLIVVDENFQNGQGMMIALKIKEDLVLKHIPIILLTGTDTAEPQPNGGGIDFYYNKDQSPQDLIQRCREALDKNYNELDLNPLTRLPGP